VWHRNPFFAKPDGRLPRTSELLKLLEHAANGLLDLTIWCLLDATVISADEPNREFPQCEPALHFLLERFACSLS